MSKIKLDWKHEPAKKEFHKTVELFGTPTVYSKERHGYALWTGDEFKKISIDGKKNCLH